MENQHLEVKYLTQILGTECSDEDSTLESDTGSSNILQTLISYQDPEYDEAQSDSNDSGIFLHKTQEKMTDVFSKTNTNLVINGLELSEICLSNFRNKKKSTFHYEKHLPLKTLHYYLKHNPTKYKR